jgi:hypothetical protein
MKFILISALAVIAAGLAPLVAAQDIPSPPTSPQGAAPEALLDALIRHSRHTARIENGRLTGDAASLLRAFGQHSQFVILGEQHGNSGISSFVTAYWRDLNELGFDYVVSESDPWITRAMERELRAGGADAWRSYIADRGASSGAPFYTWRGEVEWVNEVVARSNARRTPAIWGVDQVFIGAGPWLMREVAANARNADARTLATRLLENREGNFNWLVQIDPAQLQQLRGHLSSRRDADFAALIDAMIVSQRIYRPFTGGGGESYTANNEREHLMRALFQENFSQAETANRVPPRVMMKLGASHAFRGASTTQIQGFGGFVTEFGNQRGMQTTTVLVLCPREGQTSSFIGATASCADDDYTRNWAFIDPYLEPDALTVFDLRTWRLRPRRWQMLPADVQRAVLSFDVLVVVPPAPGAQLLEGFMPPVVSAN